MKRTIRITEVLLITALATHAEILNLSFVGSTGGYGLSVFNSHTVSVTTNGATMVFTALSPADTNAVLKGGNNWLGVDTTVDLIADKVETNEFITITFSSSVYSSITLQSISLGAVNGGDSSYYQIDSGTPVALTGGNIANTNSMPIEVLGKTLTFSLSAQSSTAPGVGITGISLELIPKPPVLSIFCISGLILPVSH